MLDSSLMYALYQLDVQAKKRWKTSEPFSHPFKSLSISLISKRGVRCHIIIIKVTLLGETNRLESREIFKTFNHIPSSFTDDPLTPEKKYEVCSSRPAYQLKSRYIFVVAFIRLIVLLNLFTS